MYPKRHELFTAQEDKLLQLYQSKLEQLHNLCGRLATLAQTLGSSFYGSDMLNPVPAPGEEDSIDGWKDVTPERFNKLERELVRGKAEVVRDPLI